MKEAFAQVCEAVYQVFRKRNINADLLFIDYDFGWQ